MLILQTTSRHTLLWMMLGLLCWPSMGRCASAAVPPVKAPPRVTMIPQEGFNLSLVQQMNTRLIVTLASPVHNWFAGTFEHLPTGHPVTLGFSLVGQDSSREKADVTKWAGLRPVMTYADPAQYASYEWFMKDAHGQWLSGDPFKTGDARGAGTGVTPTQQVIPASQAAHFLSQDGTFWSPWCEVDAATTLPNLNLFRIQQQFMLPKATLAMRIPYGNTYDDAVMRRLRAAHVPGVTVEDIGKSAQQRVLRVIRLSPPPETANTKIDVPTILVYAREHATEPDSSWVVQGVLAWLLSGTPEALAARRQAHWLLIPLLDPDHAARAHATSGDIFQTSGTPSPEALAYATYLIHWIDAGHRLDIVANLHNVECNEGPNCFATLVNPERHAAITRLNTQLFTTLTNAGYTTGFPEGQYAGAIPLRLAGWAYRAFRSLDLLYEINSRAPGHTLTLAQTQQLGAILGHALAGYVQSEDFLPVQHEMTSYLATRLKQRAAYWETVGRNPRTRTPHDIFDLGY